MEMGLLQASQLAEYPTMATDFVDYRAVIREKNKIYHLAYEQFKINQTKYHSTYDQFCTENAYWLSDFARFMTFKIHFKEKDWGSWPAEIKNRQKAALTTLEKKLIDQIDYQKFCSISFLDSGSPAEIL